MPCWGGGLWWPLVWPHRPSAFEVLNKILCDAAALRKRKLLALSFQRVDLVGFRVYGCIHKSDYLTPWNNFSVEMQTATLISRCLSLFSLICNPNLPISQYTICSENSEKIAHNLSFNNSSCYVEGSYRYMHFLATLSKIKLYSELVIHTIHAAFPPPQMIFSVSLVHYEFMPWVFFSLSLLCKYPSLN